MAALATLTFGPCAGYVAKQANGGSSPRRLPLLFPPHASHLKTGGGRDCSRRFRSVPVVRAVAVESDEIGSSDPAQEEKPRRYYFAVANAKFMLDEEEHFKELLFERRRNFGERNRELDFWLVVEPKFLDKFPSITKRLNRPAVALVSTDGPWMTREISTTMRSCFNYFHRFMKLRLDRVLTDSFEADTLEEALAYNPVDLTFDEPEKWTAPYPKYEFGWWEPFLPPGSSKSSQ